MRKKNTILKRGILSLVLLGISSNLVVPFTSLERSLKSKGSIGVGGVINSAAVAYGAELSVGSDAAFEQLMIAEGFPESYKAGLRDLHSKYPRWEFHAFNTGLDWNEVVEAEVSGTDSLVYKDSPSSWKSTDSGKYNWSSGTWTGFDGSSWVAASREIVAHYLDPRNFLDEKSVFQFLSHGYDPSSQNIEGLRQMLVGTFMESQGSAESQGSGQTVPDASSTANAESNSVLDSAATAALPSNTIDNAKQSQAKEAGASAEIGIGPIATGTVIEAGGTTTSQSSVSYDAAGTNVPSAGTSAADTSVYLSPDGPFHNDVIVLNEKTAEVFIEILSEGPGVNVTNGGSVASSTTGTGVSTASASGNSTLASDNTLTSGNTLTVTNGGTDYASIIMAASQQNGINPYVLASMILQEQGVDGRGRSIKGSNGYYNYLNVGAYASGGMGAVERGLWFASQEGSYGRPWNSIQSSINGGAMFYATNYVNKGQNTLYLKKWNVQGENKYKHQYMSNVPGANDEGVKLSKAYTGVMLTEAHDFYIPVYLNMPETPCPKPSGDGSPDNRLSLLSIEGVQISPEFSFNQLKYTATVPSAVTNINIQASPNNSNAVVEGTGNIMLNAGAGNQTVYIRVRAENGTVRTYQIDILRQEGIISW